MPREGINTMLEHVPCGLCGSDNYDVLYEPRYEMEKDLSLIHI